MLRCARYFQKDILVIVELGSVNFGVVHRVGSVFQDSTDALIFSLDIIDKLLQSSLLRSNGISDLVDNIRRRPHSFCHRSGNLVENSNSQTFSGGSCFGDGALKVVVHGVRHRLCGSGGVVQFVSVPSNLIHTLVEDLIET